MHMYFLRAINLALLVCLSQNALSEPTQGGITPWDTPLKILFIGNSYTIRNKMTDTLSALAASAPGQRPLQIKQATLSGATLDQVWELSETKHAVSDEKWDYVIIQEHSTLPTTDPERMYSAVRQIDAALKNSGAKEILYLTWARQKKPEMQASLNHAYVALARELNAKIAPVGPAWQIALNLDPALPIYDTDGSHPTPTGSYLVACVFFHVVEGTEKPCPVTPSNAITPGNAAIAQVAALKAAKLSLDEINNESYMPKKPDWFNQLLQNSPYLLTISKKLGYAP